MRQPDIEAIEPPVTADNGCFLEIHAGCSSRRNQLDEWTAVFGDYDALTALPRRLG